MRHLYFTPELRIWACAVRAESSLRAAVSLSCFDVGLGFVARRVRLHRRCAARYSKLAFALAVKHYGQMGSARELRQSSFGSAARTGCSARA